MVTVFLVARSFTTIVELLASSEDTVPAILRKLPVTTSSADSCVPSALFVPRAIIWSPAWIAVKG